MCFKWISANYCSCYFSGNWQIEKRHGIRCRWFMLQGWTWWSEGWTSSVHGLLQFSNPPSLPPFLAPLIFKSWNKWNILLYSYFSYSSSRGQYISIIFFFFPPQHLVFSPSTGCAVGLGHWEWLTQFRLEGLLWEALGTPQGTNRRSSPTGGTSPELF